MTWTDADLAAWVRSKTPPQRNGVFMTAATMVNPPISYRKCVNGIWFLPCDTAAQAQACQQIANDAPTFWRGLVRNCSPVVLRMVHCEDHNCPACVARREDGAKMLPAFEEINALVDSLRAPAC